MTVKELKKLTKKEVKNFIREKLMYTQKEIDFVSKKLKDPFSVELFSNIQPNLKLHRRFEMGEDHPDNDKILHFFDDLKLLEMFDYFELTFYKGCGDISWVTKKEAWLGKELNKDVYINEQNLCGEGTIDIIYIIMCKVWTLKQG